MKMFRYFLLLAVILFPATALFAAHDVKEKSHPKIVKKEKLSSEEKRNLKKNAKNEKKAIKELEKELKRQEEMEKEKKLQEEDKPPREKDREWYKKAFPKGLVNADEPASKASEKHFDSLKNKFVVIIGFSQIYEGLIKQILAFKKKRKGFEVVLVSLYAEEEIMQKNVKEENLKALALPFGEKIGDEEIRDRLEESISVVIAPDGMILECGFSYRSSNKFNPQTRKVEKIESSPKEVCHEFRALMANWNAKNKSSGTVKK